MSALIRACICWGSRITFRFSNRSYKVFRLKTEGSKLSRKARIEQFKTFSEFCMITHDLPLKAFSLQPIHLSSYQQSAISKTQEKLKAD
jgi:hypothetical protein